VLANLLDVIGHPHRRDVQGQEVADIYRGPEQ
jgi:hypothetical protein